MYLTMFILYCNVHNFFETLGQTSHSLTFQKKKGLIHWNGGSICYYMHVCYNGWVIHPQCHGMGIGCAGSGQPAKSDESRGGIEGRHSVSQVVTDSNGGAKMYGQEERTEVLKNLGSKSILLHTSSQFVPLRNFHRFLS